MNATDLKMLINKYFGSQKAFAKVMGMKESNLSKRIAQPNPKFLVQCKKAGLPVQEILGPQHPTAAEEINKLNSRIKQLEKDLAEKEKFIEQQSKLIDLLQGGKKKR